MQDLSQFFESSDVKPERYSCTSATKTRQGATFRARPSLCERITSGSHVLQDDSITNLRRALDDGACAQLERSPRTPYDGGYPPWAQIVIYPNHHAVAVEEHDVDSKPHEHHVHAHERLEPPGLEQHPGILVALIARRIGTRFVRALSMVPPLAGKSPARFERALLSPPRPLYYNPRETERGH